MNGRDSLGSDIWNASAHAEEEAPIVVKSKMEELINQPDVVRALNTP